MTLQYEVSGYVYIDEESPVLPSLSLEFWNAENKRIYQEAETPEGTTGVWHNLVKGGVAPAEAVTVSAWLYAGTSFNGVVYWDHVQLIRVDD